MQYMSVVYLQYCLCLNHNQGAKATGSNPNVIQMIVSAIIFLFKINN